MKSHLTDALIVIDKCKTLIKLSWGHVDVVYPLVLEYYYRGELCRHMIEEPNGNPRLPSSSGRSISITGNLDNSVRHDKPQTSEKQMLR